MLGFSSFEYLVFILFSLITLQTAGERALAELERGLDIPSDYDDEEKARQDLLADDSPQSSDSGEVIFLLRLYILSNGQLVYRSA